MQKALIMILSFILLTVSGCATLLKGNKEEIIVDSDPSGANVSINNQHAGTTPYVAKVKSSEKLDIELSKTGYQPLSLNDDTSFRWGYEIWSFVEWVIPMGIDMVDGSAWGHNQTMIAAHLEPLPHPAATAPVTSAAPASTASPTAPPAAQSGG